MYLKITSCCIFLLFLQQLVPVDADIYASMYEIDKAYKIFVNKKKLFVKNIKHLQEPNKRTLEKAISGLSYYEKLASPLANPIDVYHILNLLINVNMVMQKDTRPTVQRHLSALPTTEDIVGIVKRILSLQMLYEVHPRDVAKGYFQDLPRAQPLSAAQRMLLGNWAFGMQFYSIEMPWLIEALKAQQEVVDFGETDFMEFFSAKEYEEYYRKLVYHFLINKQLNLAKHVADTMTQTFGYNDYSYLSSGRGGLYKYCATIADVKDKNFKSVFESIENSWDKELQSVCVKEIRRKEGYCRYATPSSFYILRPIEEEVLSKSPHVRMWHRVVKDHEIATIINYSAPRLVRAGTIGIAKDDRRQSKHHFIKDYDPVYDELDDKLALITGVNIEPNGRNAEEYQANNYGIGGFYNFHVDFHDGDVSTMTYNPGNNWFDHVTQQFSDRIATIQLYLSDIQAGGATAFPLLNLSVIPRKGSIIMWYNLLRNGERNWRTRHAGCPVLSGSKWVANKWVKYHGQMHARPCTLDKMAD